MITVTGRDTCRAAYVDEKFVTKITEHSEDIDGRAYPWSRIFISDPKQNHEYSIDVVESKKKIQQMIKEAGKNGDT